MPDIHTAPLRACAYVRVSTEDQAAHGISIPSQIKRIEEFCNANGWQLVETYSEPGQSGKDAGRPQFKKMISRATSSARPYDLIVVYALSRLARSLEIQIPALAQLQVAGVRLVSATESFDRGANGNLMRSMVGAFNQHTSDQCSMNTIRAMSANAQEGFFNGGPVPYGYQSVVVEKRGDKAKKKLALKEDEAAIVEKIFRLAEVGDGEGPLGARKIATWLNERGYALRGGRFNNANIANILSRSHYTGCYFDGKMNEFKEPIPEEQWIRVPCPSIVSEETFLNVAALRAKRAPRATPPRVTNGVTMLPASIAKCGLPSCGAGLTVRTGKGGRYHYYTCNAKVNRSAESCDLKAIPRDDLDRIVLDQVARRIFDQDRLVLLLQHLLERSEEVTTRRRKDLALARAELTTVTKAITNLLMTIETGAISPQDTFFVERMAHNRKRKSALEADIRALERQLSTSKAKITEETVKEFASKMKEKLQNGDPRFRAQYVRLFVSRVELTADEIRIFGSKEALEKALIHDQGSGAAEVPIFDQEWCRLQDSNLWPHHYENSSFSQRWARLENKWHFSAIFQNIKFHL